MSSFLAMVRSNIKLQAVLSIVLGALLAFMPQITTLTVVYLLALYIAVMGVASLFSYYRGKGEQNHAPSVLTTGVLLLVVALVMCIFPHAVAGFFSLILGILLTIGGVVNVVRAIELRQYQGNLWPIALIVSAAVAVGGIIIVINPFKTMVLFVLVLGILLIVKGVTDLVLEVSLSQAAKQQQR